MFREMSASDILSQRSLEYLGRGRDQLHNKSLSTHQHSGYMLADCILLVDPFYYFVDTIRRMRCSLGCLGSNHAIPSNQEGGDMVFIGAIHW